MRIVKIEDEEDDKDFDDWDFDESEEDELEEEEDFIILEGDEEDEF
jgi:hypothetical protein